MSPKYIALAAILAIPFLFWVAQIMNAASRRIQSETHHQLVVLSTLVPVAIIYLQLFLAAVSAF